MDYDLFFSEEVNTPCLVFIHGAGGDKTQWYLQQHFFQKLGWKVLILSLPKHGLSNQIKEVSISNYANAILNLIITLKLEQVTLIGHSMGGAIAIQLALNDSNNLVSSLVLIGAGAKLKVTPIFFELIETDFIKFLDLMKEFGYNKETKEDVKNRIEEILKNCGPDVFLQDFKACNAFDIREELSNLKIPILIICGENDMMTPSKYSTYLHEKISNSKLSLIPNAGHYVFLESSNEVNKVIEEFLKQIR
ncbi:MAG: alpha/beta fold hydrolase [Candidatus Hodarchaeota archaeon]